MGFALRHIHLPHYTYEDYCKWEGDWELIDGIPYSMSPSPFFKHQSVLSKIIYQLEEALNKCGSCNVVLEMDWIVKDDTVVRPDAMVFCGKIKDDEHLKFPPEIIFEILSDSTAMKDRTVKYDLYKEHHVKYYVIIQTKPEQVTVYQLEKNEYLRLADASKMKFEINHCKFNFDFGKIWR